MSDEKPACFGEAYGIRCNDCTVGLECEKYSRIRKQQIKEPVDPENQLSLRITELRGRELECQQASRLIFKDELIRPLDNLFHSMEHIYPDRDPIKTLAPIVLKMARDTIDDLMDDF